ncbi:hypothetical protein N657DRAFT_195108 [Parathielavia appendiculata]|uniref:Uncharacterized protein n=1 Tax=Parathielavia appendiculata TaxID=2587402 RepID=A0AAN6Z772_9PEZI|nr:hypothetical protein N657DRAFT_195108 [Parathielavia appendiculata]
MKRIVGGVKRALKGRRCRTASRRVDVQKLQCPGAPRPVWTAWWCVVVVGGCNIKGGAPRDWGARPRSMRDGPARFSKQPASGTQVESWGGSLAGGERGGQRGPRLASRAGIDGALHPPQKSFLCSHMVLSAWSRISLHMPLARTARSRVPAREKRAVTERRSHCPSRYLTRAIPLPL